jgi:hypothetical protein
VRRRERGAVEVEGDLVHIAEPPALAGFVRADEWVARQLRVRGAVFARRAVAATHMPAGLAHTKMDPVTLADGQTLCAAIERPWLGENAEIDRHVGARLG